MAPFETLSMRPEAHALIYRLLALSTATPVGWTRKALVAGTLSCWGRPATVVITPFETLRMRWLSVGNVEVARGVHSDADGLAQLGAGGRAVVAAETKRPVSRHGGDHPVRDFADAVVTAVGNVKVAGGVHGDADGAFNWALVAGPLSPLKPDVPFPATVVITPFETLRMRLLPVSAI